MALNINEIRSQLALGGARPTLFQVIFNNPVNAAGDVKIPFMVKGSQIPASSLGTIEVPYFGRKIKIAGDRTFAEWPITVINDENFTIRTAFEAWHNLIAKLDNNSGATNPSAYMVNAFVYQLGRGYSQGLESTSNSDTENNTRVDPLRTYKFVDIFPTAVSDIALSYDSGDTIEEFTVEFAVQNIENGGDDQNVDKIS